MPGRAAVAPHDGTIAGQMRYLRVQAIAACAAATVGKRRALAAVDTDRIRLLGVLHGVGITLVSGTNGAIWYAKRRTDHMPAKIGGLVELLAFLQALPEPVDGEPEPVAAVGLGTLSRAAKRRAFNRARWARGRR